MTSLLPLVFVISVTAAKQGYEDFLRYKTDNIVNCAPVTIIRNGKEEYIESQYIAPGDLVLVERDCDVPCDLVLIRSSDSNGKCFITTANLDGESNLKTLMVPRELPLMDLDMLNTLGIIECEIPKTDLYSFSGKIDLTNSNGIVLPLTAENVLLRGSRVKNTECVIGCAIYTGMTTKLQLNSRLTRNKFASSEAYINRFLLFVLISLIAIVTILYFLKRYNEMFVIPHLTYLGPPVDSYSVKQFLQDYLSFLILFNYLIPISLYVTIEMHRVLGGLFMEWDINLYDEATDQPCIVNTSNLNEELGQINILFSDKTGTLTKNEMIFQQCSIAGRKYLYKKTRLQEEGKSFEVDITKFNKHQKNFFHALSVCHTVQVASVSSISKEETLFEKAETEKKMKNALYSSTPLYSFSDITEENRSSNQQSDVNTMETSFNTHPRCDHSVVNTSTHISSDVNPLLYDKAQTERRKRPQIVKRSPNFTRTHQKVYPISTQLQALEMVRCVKVASGFELRQVIFPSSLQTVSTTKPLSMQFKRSTSEMNLDYRISNNAGTVFGILGHRRSQSNGAAGVYRTKTANHEVVNRTSSSASRESYAAPNFQRQLTVLYRAESTWRKTEIQKIVQ